MKIIVDAMGGDRAPDEIVRGALEAAAECGCELVLCGDSARIGAAAQAAGMSTEGHRIVHTDIAVTMEDDPMVVLHAKKDSSLCVGLRLLADGEGDAFVSAGSTGALFTAASLIVRRLPGVRRAAIATILPMDPPVLLLDAGANVTVTDEYLEQFALLGSIYMRTGFGLERPRVGLLNNGLEDHKGTPLQVETYRRLSDNESINFVGNIEADRISQNVCDVLVTDGFTGNILLKSIEGMGGLMFGALRDCFYANARTKLAALLVKKQLGGLKGRFDSSAHGGAPLLGLRRPVFKAHGSSNARAFKNAVLQAASYAGSEASDDIAAELQKLKHQHATAEPAAKETK